MAKNKAQQRAGERYGRPPAIWANGRGNENRIKYLQRLFDRGELVDVDGVLIPKAADLMGELNRDDVRGGADWITSPETVRRWVRGGCQGVEK